MKILYLDCAMGAAGDMLMAALWELLDRQAQARFLQTMNALGLPGIRLEAGPDEKCGIRGTHMRVFVRGQEEHAQEADGGAHAHHHHAHTDLSGLEQRIAALPLPEAVRADIRAVYHAIAEAESRVHGRPVDQIHFHEVGSLDALADVAGVCLLMFMLAPEKIVCSPVHVGSGQVRCAHGLLPVPAPATALLLTGVPIYGGSIRGELCTPTGAALVRRFADAFGPMPQMIPEKIGYGTGSRDFEAANCVRAVLGRTQAEEETVFTLACNLDDMTPEELGFAMEQLLAGGALDVWTTPIGMKKSRPGVMLSCLCTEKTRQALTERMFRHTTTLGVRVQSLTRAVLERRTAQVQTQAGPVRIKEASGWGVAREKPEFEDLARIAREKSCSLRQARALLDEQRQTQEAPQ